MGTKFICLIVMCVFCVIGANAQSPIKIDTISQKYYNLFTDTTQIVEEYRIQNNSDEDYLTWISLDSVSGKSDLELVQNYFKKLRCKSCFNFIQAMYEDLLDGEKIGIGFSFLVKIAAGESFSYFIAKKNCSSSIYNERIVVLSKKTVDKYIRLPIYDKVYYKSPFIILSE